MSVQSLAQETDFNCGVFGIVVQSDQGTHHQQGRLLRELWEGAAPRGQSCFLTEEASVRWFFQTLSILCPKSGPTSSGKAVAMVPPHILWHLKETWLQVMSTVLTAMAKPYAGLLCAELWADSSARIVSLTLPVRLIAVL